MSYASRIEAVRQLIKEHNDALGVNSPSKVNADDFISKLQAAGGTNEERIKRVDHADLLDFLPTVTVADENGVVSEAIKPVFLMKDIANALRGKGEEDDGPRPQASAKKADKMSYKELVDAFDPEDIDSAVARRLKSLSRGEPFVVFSTGRIVDTTSTLKLFLEVKNGYEGLRNFEVDGDIKQVYCIGELPDNFADENPLYAGRPLRPDGSCDQTGRSWENVPQEVRQLIRLAVDGGELEVTIENAHNVLDIVMNSNALARLKARYREAAVNFTKLAATGELPTLKVALVPPKAKSERAAKEAARSPF